MRSLLCPKTLDSTAISKSITGKYARGVNNRLMMELESADYDFPIQHYATSYLRAKARELNQFEYTGIWLGQHQSYLPVTFNDLINAIKKQF